MADQKPLGEEGEAEPADAAQEAGADDDPPRVDAVGQGHQQRGGERVADIGCAADPGGLGVAEPPLGDEDRDQRLKGERAGHRQHLHGAEHQRQAQAGVIAAPRRRMP
jgi:hypothetical protein